VLDSLRFFCPRCGTELHRGHSLLSCPKCRADFVLEFADNSIRPLLLAIKRGAYFDDCEFDPRHPNFATRRRAKQKRPLY
jgi:hypothetical protein